jgi:SAM-dependent methyltransferase
MKDTAFYNTESAVYSAKRYPVRPETFTQYFFKARLACALSLLDSLLQKKETSVLEIGSADGIVARAVWEQFPNTRAHFDAIDISPEMIRVASTRHADTAIQFSVRKAHELSGTYDLVLQLGVLNYLDIDVELPQIQKILAWGGHYVCSISASSSLQHRLKGSDGYRHLHSYEEYEALLRQHFFVRHTEAVGFFIPFLWRIPMLARFTQPIVEWFGKNLVPALALEKIYVLEAKS